MEKQAHRRPKGYDGSDLTSRKFSDLLYSILSRIESRYQERPDLLLAAWPEVIGSPLASMTKAVSFDDGVLLVKVKNSTLHSLLSQQDKPRILAILRKKFPKIEIKTIVFRIG